MRILILALLFIFLPSISQAQYTENEIHTVCEGIKMRTVVKYNLPAKIDNSVVYSYVNDILETYSKPIESYYRCNGVISMQKGDGVLNALVNISEIHWYGRAAFIMCNQGSIPSKAQLADHAIHEAIYTFPPTDDVVRIIREYKLKVIRHDNNTTSITLSPNISPGMRY